VLHSEQKVTLMSGAGQADCEEEMKLHATVVQEKDVE